MNSALAVFLLLNLSFGNCDFQSYLSVLKLRTSNNVQANAVNNLSNRLLGSDKAELFSFNVDASESIDGKETFRITKTENETSVTIVGSSGVAAAWGLNYYLKSYCGCHISWDGDQLKLPEVLPTVNVTISSFERLKYYQNVCTSSYSFVWWNWTRWEREIDWMALNGINLALAFTAQEAIWQRVYDGFGLNQTDFTGPAFLAWNRMGNLRNFGGGISINYHQYTVDLQHKILNRMRELGITPVLPAFAGPVPRSFKKVFPLADVTLMSQWNRFSDQNCCPYLLSPNDTMFPVVSRIFLREYISEFGTNHIYNCDTFNENTPASSDPEYLADTSRAIFDGISNVDPLAIWMLQGWMFINPFWGEEQVKAYVTAIPQGRMLILDLQSDLTPQYERFESYYGQPFIWCTLHNFGGQLGLYGHLEKVNSGVVNGRNFPNSTMVGIGITPEGIDQNYVMYDFTLDSSIRSATLNLTEWIANFATRRYGFQNDDAIEAWQLLKDTAYNYNLEYLQSSPKIRRKKKNQVPFADHIAKNILTKLPTLTMTEIIWYNRTEIFEAYQKFLKASKEEALAASDLFQHDFVDLTRQTIQASVSLLYERLTTDYTNDNFESFQNSSSNFLNILDELDVILASSKKFLLGRWLESAKSCAQNENETIQYEYNARNQITLWGPKGEIRDYAAKQWSGMVSDFYKPRWEIFISSLNESLATGNKYNASAVRNRIFLEVEEPFTYSNKSYPIEPNGNSIEVIHRFNENWFDILTDLFSHGDSNHISVVSI